MMSESIWYEGMDIDADHDVTLILPGNTDTLLQRLPAALSQLGYKVISYQPLFAKRRAVGGAKYACSFEPLDYPVKLTVGLRPLNHNATEVTFYYEVKSYGWSLSQGDKETLQLEAEAVAALATPAKALSTCGACGTEVTDDSRFCRSCGVPLMAATPELEVYRLTRGIRASLRDIRAGAVFVLLPALISLALAIFRPHLTPKAGVVVLTLLVLLTVFGGWALLEGLWELYRTANPKENNGGFTSFTERPALRPPLLAGAPANALPSRPARFSVTEQTTEILTPEPVPVSLFDNRDTAEMKTRRAASGGF